MIRMVQFKWFLAIALGLPALGALRTTSGDTITHGTTTVNMDFVTVGNPGNPDHIYNENYGGVDYVYDIGKYEVSENQWDAVVAANAGDLLSPGLSSTGYWSGDQPVGYVSYNEAAMFCNWLTSGDVTEGAYQIKVIVNGQGFVESVDKMAAESLYGTVYYLPDRRTSGTRRRTTTRTSPAGPRIGTILPWMMIRPLPTVSTPPATPDLTPSSATGTHRASQMTSTTRACSVLMARWARGATCWSGTTKTGGRIVAFFGGSYVSNNTGLHAAYRGYLPKSERMAGLGFRVATSSTIPEPGSWVMLASLAVMGLIWWRRRKMKTQRPGVTDPAAGRT